MSETAEIEIVRSCLRACEAFDADRATENFADDAVLWNAPIPPLRGKTKIKKILARLFSLCTAFEATVHHVACDQSVVLIERTDTIHLRGIRVSAPLTAVVHVENGKIVEWRDYFDLLYLVRQLALQSARRLVELISFGLLSGDESRD